ncbi:MAG TPA: nucleotidyltransferase family protein, partial [Acetobacteraceae bacterium]|nr:nucleotidyltransferase family protein [Acetobacteraceae bacterium]
SRAEPGVARLERIIMASPILAPIVSQWEAITLPDCWLVAGAVVQAVWNDLFGLEPNHGVKDVDLVYFDDSDLTQQTEANHEARIRELFSGEGITIDVKNEARVHLWYARKFGGKIAPYTSTWHAITTFPTTATAIGVQPAGSGLLISAPFGLADLLGAIVRPNKVQITEAIYAAKVMRWRACWPGLTIVDWADHRIEPV